MKGKGLRKHLLDDEEEEEMNESSSQIDMVHVNGPVNDDHNDNEDDKLNTSSLSMAALHGVFATQQNDFALGLPVISALYPGDANAKLRSYIYIFSTISLIIINPIAFFIMRLGTHHQQKGKEKTKNGLQTFPSIYLFFY